MTKKPKTKLPQFEMSQALNKICSKHGNQTNTQLLLFGLIEKKNHAILLFKITCTACSGTTASVDCADEQPIDTSSLGTVNPSGDVTTVVQPVQPVQPIVTTGAPPEMGGGAKGRRFLI